MPNDGRRRGSPLLGRDVTARAAFARDRLVAHAHHEEGAQRAALDPVRTFLRPDPNKGIVDAIARVAGTAEHVPRRRLQRRGVPAVRFFERPVGMGRKRRIEFPVVVHPVCNDRSLSAANVPANATLRYPR